MIEVVLNGFYVDEPYDVGGAGAVISTSYGEVAQLRRRYAAGELRTWSAAELAILVDALEELRRRRLDGEEVLVRTGLSSLVDCCRGTPARAPADARPWVKRLHELAGSFAEIRTQVSPGWVTVPAQDLAIRAALERAADAGGRACPKCRAAAAPAE